MQGPFSQSEAFTGFQTGGPQQSDGRFSHSRYVVSRKLLKLIGAAFYVHDPNGQLILYANQKAFKLKEDIRLYTGEDMTREVLSIKARSIMDFSAAYDVVDAQTGQKVGTLKRKGLQSWIQDEWAILDAQDREMGTVKEDNAMFALIRRFIDFAAFVLPQSFEVTLGNRPVGIFKQTRNPFSSKLEADLTPDTGNVLDRRLALAAAVLLVAIEGKQTG
jgi:uncharacterized protein YxjI